MKKLYLYRLGGGVIGVVAAWLLSKSSSSWPVVVLAMFGAIYLSVWVEKDTSVRLDEFIRFLFIAFMLSSLVLSL